MTLGRAYIRRRIRHRVENQALVRLELWRKLWRFGGVTLVVPGESQGQEVEIALPKRQEVTAALKNALQSLPGVASIESV